MTSVMTSAMITRRPPFGRISDAVFGMFGFQVTEPGQVSLRSPLMGYELRVERDAPLAYAELASVVSAQAGFELRGSHEAGEVVARHGDSLHHIATWSGRLIGQPGSDWQVAQLARLTDLVGARLVGEDGEAYGIRNGVVEQIAGSATYEFGKLDEIIEAGPTEWSA
jgi:hypothetical protein